MQGGWETLNVRGDNLIDLQLVALGLGAHKTPPALLPVDATVAGVNAHSGAV